MNVKRLGALLVAFAMIATAMPALAGNATVGDFVVRLAKARNLGATDARVAAEKARPAPAPTRRSPVCGSSPASAMSPKSTSTAKTVARPSGPTSRSPSASPTPVASDSASSTLPAKSGTTALR